MEAFPGRQIPICTWRQDKSAGGGRTQCKFRGYHRRAGGV